MHSSEFIRLSLSQVTLAPQKVQKTIKHRVGDSILNNSKAHLHEENLYLNRDKVVNIVELGHKGTITDKTKGNKGVDLCYKLDIKTVELSHVTKSKKSVFNVRKINGMGKALRFASWNVRTLLAPGKLKMLVDILSRYKVEVACLQETHLKDSGIKIEGDYTFIYSGRDDIFREGVAIALHKSIANMWKDSGSRWEAISSRIIKLSFETKWETISIVATYAPTNQDTQTNIGLFYQQLQDAIKVKKNQILIIAGDFNARIGHKERCLGNTIGEAILPYEETDQNGQHLIDFALLNSLMVTGTWFFHKAIHKGTWMHPGTKKWHTMDHILVPSQMRNSVTDV